MFMDGIQYCDSASELLFEWFIEVGVGVLRALFSCSHCCRIKGDENRIANKQKAKINGMRKIKKKKKSDGRRSQKEKKW